jgi:predicted nucleic acid-binding protein
MSFRTPRAPVVVDASITVGIAAGEEAAIAAAEALDAATTMLLAPPLLWSETANALLRGARLPTADVIAAVDALERIGIEPADRGARGLREAIILADRHRLSVYDAAYLWLAIDVDGELATLDRQLARAAVAEGVPLTLNP